MKFDSYRLWKMCCEWEKFAKKEWLKGRTTECCPGTLFLPLSQRSARHPPSSPLSLLKSWFPYSFMPFSEHLTVLDCWQCWAVFSFSEVSDSCILKVSDSWLETTYSEMIAPSQEPLEGLAVGMAQVVLKQLLNHCSSQLSLLRSPGTVSCFLCYNLNWMTTVIQSLLSLHLSSPGVK